MLDFLKQHTHDASKPHYSKITQDTVVEVQITSRRMLSAFLHAN